MFNLSQPLSSLLRDLSPQVVAVELDRRRLQGLLRPPVDQLQALGGGSSSLLYRFLAVSQQQLASSFAMRPGEEMLVAVRVGWELGARVMLIDMDPQRLIRRAWKRAPLRERARLLLEIFKLYVASGEVLVEEIEAQKGDFSQQLEEFSDTFPSFKPELVDRRDRVMARRLGRLHELHGSVVAVVGDGHITGLSTHLEKYDPQIIRLKQLLGIGVGRVS